MIRDERVDRWIRCALEASGAMTTSELVRHTGSTLGRVLLALRDMQQADEVRRTTAGRYRLMVTRGHA